MPKIYDKLVRDNIPDIIASEGRMCKTEIMTDADYKQALRDKIVEEGEEIRTADDNDLINEIADLYEVIDALIAMYGLSEADIRDRQAQRRKSRGRFEKRIKLLSTSD